MNKIDQQAGFKFAFSTQIVLDLIVKLVQFVWMGHKTLEVQCPVLDRIKLLQYKTWKKPSQPTSETSTILITVQNNSAFEPWVFLRTWTITTSKETCIGNFDRRSNAFGLRNRQGSKTVLLPQLKEGIMYWISEVLNQTTGLEVLNWSCDLGL